MITIKNSKIEALVGEILKRTPYADPLTYLEARIRRDYEKIIRKQKLD